MDELFREGDLRVAWEAPPGLAPVPRDAPDVSALPGARVVAQASYGDASTIALAGCVRGPSDRFVAGLEGVLFDKATWLVLRAVDAQPIELAVTATGGSIADGYILEDRVGKVRDGALTIRSALTFVGGDRDVLLCAAACVTRADAPCAASTTTLHADGEHGPPPDPALWMRAVFYAAEHPLEVGAAFAVLFIAVAVVLVRRRPRSQRLA